MGNLFSSSETENGLVRHRDKYPRLVPKMDPRSIFIIDTYIRPYLPLEVLINFYIASKAVQPDLTMKNIKKTLTSSMRNSTDDLSEVHTYLLLRCVMNNAMFLRSVPHQYQTPKMCLIAVGNNPEVYPCAFYRTPEMLDMVYSCPALFWPRGSFDPILPEIYFGWSSYWTKYDHVSSSKMYALFKKWPADPVARELFENTVIPILFDGVDPKHVPHACLDQAWWELLIIVIQYRMRQPSRIPDQTSRERYNRNLSNLYTRYVLEKCKYTGENVVDCGLQWGAGSPFVGESKDSAKYRRKLKYFILVRWSYTDNQQMLAELRNRFPILIQRPNLITLTATVMEYDKIYYMPDTNPYC